VLSNGQGAACWLVISPDGEHAYTTNAATANVSRYRIAPNGALSLEAGFARTTAPGAIDLDLTDGDRVPVRAQQQLGRDHRIIQLSAGGP
jgi:6-phosphogluconolactonase (cycloisomerase 2 family)